MEEGGYERWVYCEGDEKSMSSGIFYSVEEDILLRDHPRWEQVRHFVNLTRVQSLLLDEEWDNNKADSAPVLLSALDKILE